MAKKTDTTEDKIHVVEEALSKSEQFIEKHQKTLIIIIGAIIVIGLGIFAFQRLFIVPREKEAQGQMFMAQKYFEQDSLNKALNGDGNYVGFLSIIDDYSMTKASNLAKYYTGIIYLKQGKYEDAITYLGKFNGKDELVGPMATGGIGDAYTELGQKEKALDYYLKAADQRENNMTTSLYLMRAAWTYEDLGKFDKALELYTKIQKEHPKSMESRDIDKYIERAKAMAGK
ncbi:MAG: tetratricopeptide repeat protein [Bacteroidales bacterium]|nr:tetratricopeptide repeat protein [Bacteroidales bacterium]